VAERLSDIRSLLEHSHGPAIVPGEQGVPRRERTARCPATGWTGFPVALPTRRRPSSAPVPRHTSWRATSTATKQGSWPVLRHQVDGSRPDRRVRSANAERSRSAPSGRSPASSRVRTMSSSPPIASPT
jgi:hypothetical protein